MSISQYADLLKSDLHMLPDIKFTEHVNDLDLRADILQNTIIEMCDPVKLQNPDTRVNELFRVYNAIRSNSVYTNLFEPFTRMNKLLSGSMRRSYELLTDKVKADVDELNQSVDDAVATDGIDDTTDNENNDVVAGEESMNVMDWNRYSNMLGGREFLVNHHRDLYSYASESFHDISYVLASNKFKLDRLSDQNEVKREFVRVANKKCQDDEVTKFTVMSLLELANSPYEFDELTSRLHSVCTDNDISLNLPRICSWISQVNPIIGVVKNWRFNISRSNQEKLTKNLEKIQEVMYLGGYTLLAARKHYRDSLVMSPTMINGDQYDDFINHGGTMKDVINYVNYYSEVNNNSDHIPAKGFDSNTILSARSGLKRRKLEASQAKESVKKMNRHLREVNALRNALHDYIVGTPDEFIPENMSRLTFIDNNLARVEGVCNLLDASPDTNRDNLLYDFVLKTHFAGTPIVRMHERLSEEVAKAAKSGDLSEIDDDAIISSVSSEIIADAIARNAIVKKDDKKHDRKK